MVATITHADPREYKQFEHFSQNNVPDILISRKRHGII